MNFSGLAIGGPMHGQTIEHHSPTFEAADYTSTRGVRLLHDSPLDDFRKVRYRVERVAFQGSSRAALMWVAEVHSKEAAGAIWWELALESLEKRQGDR